MFCLSCSGCLTWFTCHAYNTFRSSDAYKTCLFCILTTVKILKRYQVYVYLAYRTQDAYVRVLLIILITIRMPTCSTYRITLRVLTFFYLPYLSYMPTYLVRVKLIILGMLACHMKYTRKTAISEGTTTLDGNIDTVGLSIPIPNGRYIYVRVAMDSCTATPPRSTPPHPTPNYRFICTYTLPFCFAF